MFLDDPRPGAAAIEEACLVLGDARTLGEHQGKPGPPRVLVAERHPGDDVEVGGEGPLGGLGEVVAEIAVGGQGPGARISGTWWFS